MQITRRQSLLAAFAGAFCGFLGLPRYDLAAAYGPSLDQAILPSFETTGGRFDVVYSSLDLAPFDVTFDLALDKLMIIDREGRRHESNGTAPCYVGLLCLKAATEVRRLNGLLVEPPRIYLVYCDTENACLAATGLSWSAAKVLLPQIEFAAMLRAVDRARLKTGYAA